MAAYGKPTVTGQSQQRVTQVKPRTVKVKAHTRRVAPRAPAFNPNAQPITPGSGITVGQANRMAGNAVTTRYGPQQSQLTTNVARNTQLGHDQAGWYDAYLRELQQHRDNIAQSEAQSNTAVAGLANSLRSVDQSTLAQNQAANNADAANRGASVGQQVSTNADNASLVRQALMGSFGAELANRGKNATDYADTLAHVVGPGQKLQAQAGNARTGQELLKQLADLKGQSGAYKQQFLDSLTQQEAKNVLAAQIANLNYGAKVATLKETTRRDTLNSTNAKARIKATTNSPSSQKTAADLAFFKQHGYYPPTGPPKSKTGAKTKPVSGPGSLSPAKEADIVNQIHQVISIIKNAPTSVPVLDENGKPKKDANGKVITRTLDDHGIRHNLVVGTNPLKKVIDPRIINIAFDIARRGGLSEPNVKAAHDLRIHVNGHFNILSKQSPGQKAIQKTAEGVYKV